MNKDRTQNQDQNKNQNQNQDLGNKGKYQEGGQDGLGNKGQNIQNEKGKKNIGGLDDDTV